MSKEDQQLSLINVTPIQCTPIAYALFIRDFPNDPRFLVSRRADHLLGFVGGKYEESDAILVNTMERESREEISITIEDPVISFYLSTCRFLNQKNLYLASVFAIFADFLPKESIFENLESEKQLSLDWLNIHELTREVISGKLVASALPDLDDLSFYYQVQSDYMSLRSNKCPAYFSLVHRDVRQYIENEIY